MAAAVPTQISNLPPHLRVASTRTKQLPPSSPSYAPRNARIPSALNSFRILPVTTGVYLQTVPNDRLSGSQTYQLFCLHRLAASLPSLSTLSCTRSLCFQSFAASFPKTPGWGYRCGALCIVIVNLNVPVTVTASPIVTAWRAGILLRAGKPCHSRRAHSFMRLAQATFYEWVAGLSLCAREQSVPRLTVLLNRGMLRWCGWLVPNKGGRLPQQHWDRTSRFVPPKTARIWFIKSIPRRGTNTLTRVRSNCTPGTAIFAASDTRRRET